MGDGMPGGAGFFGGGVGNGGRGYQGGGGNDGSMPETMTVGMDDGGHPGMQMRHPMEDIFGGISPARIAGHVIKNIFRSKVDNMFGRSEP